jgi:hypothetical protein
VLAVIGSLPFVLMADDHSRSAANLGGADVLESAGCARGAARQGPAAIDEKSGSAKPTPEQLQSELDRVNRSPPIVDGGPEAPVQGPPQGTETRFPSLPSRLTK